MYETISGDTWDLIAYKLYDNEYVVDKLMEANPIYLDIAIFPAGVQLVVPDLEAAVIVSTDLPPWLR